MGKEQRIRIVILKPQLFVSGYDIAPREKRFLPVTNNIFFHKPKTGGLWTSTYEDGSSGWVKWCVSEEYGGPTFPCWILEPEDSNIIEIATEKDCKTLFNKYGCNRFPPGTSFAKKAIADGLLTRGLDFEQMDKDGIDGIHLTEEGQWATRFSHPGLYGWDCESTIWLRWKFKKSTKLGILAPKK